MKNRDFDSTEKHVYRAMSDIKVDTDALRRRLSQKTAPVGKRRLPLAAALVAVLILVALTATVGATGIGLPQFLSRFNPAFGDIAIPPGQPAYADRDGIRIEVVGAQQIANAVLLYMTAQDITGGGRLPADVWPDVEIYRNGEVVGGASRTRRLHFDAAKNRVYFEKIIIGDLGERSDTLELVVHSLQHSGGRDGQLQTVEVALDMDEALAAYEPEDTSWRIVVNTSETADYLVWHNIDAGDIFIETMVLTPMGLFIAATHDGTRRFSFSDRSQLQVQVSSEGRRRNLRFEGGSGGGSQHAFSLSFFADIPIDVGAVTAIYVDGVRIPR